MISTRADWPGPGSGPGFTVTTAGLSNVASNCSLSAAATPTGAASANAHPTPIIHNRRSTMNSIPGNARRALPDMGSGRDERNLYAAGRGRATRLALRPDGHRLDLDPQTPGRGARAAEDALNRRREINGERRFPGLPAPMTVMTPEESERPDIVAVGVRRFRGKVVAVD